MTSDSTAQNAPAFSMDDFAQALEKYDYEFSKGQLVKGTVIQHDSEGAYVDIGGKSPGFVPEREADVDSYASLTAVLPIGEPAEFMVIKEQNAEGQITLSRRQIQLKAAWDNVREMAEGNKSIQMRVTGTNKGGITGEVEGLRGFIPRSHLQQRDNLESLVGQLITATFLEVDQEKRKLVLSQRDAMKAAAMTKITEKVVADGTVVSIKPYGAFVDLGGVSGLLHIREISGSRIESIESVLEQGKEIKVYIAQIDEYKNRISLSTKIFEEYPGELLENFDEVMANADERLAKAQAQAESAS